MTDWFFFSKMKSWKTAYCKTSIKHAPKLQIDIGNNWKIAEIVRKTSNLWYKFDVFLTVWAILQLFPQLIWYLGARFIQVLLYLDPNHTMTAPVLQVINPHD